LRHKTDLAHPVARSIYIAHMEVRNRALQAVLALAADDPDEALHWNRLRHRTDRWLDYLLAYLLDDEAVLEFAANRERALEFHDDLRRSPSDAHRRNAWPLVAASIRAAFPPRRSDAAGNSDLNEQIASSLLAALPAEAFDSVGLFKSLWLVRLENTTADAQGMIERLFREERLDRAPIDSREKAKKRFHL
jgi:hypothetical protein